MSDHEPVVRVLSLNDELTPFLTIETHCTCGAHLSTRKFDVRSDPTGAAEILAMGDVETFIAHLRECARDR